MSYTGNEVFAMAISILDELSDSGTIVDSQINEYKYRAPYLLDMWQKEIGDSLQTIEEYENTDADNNYKWDKFALPTNLKRIKEIMFINSESQISSIPYKRFGDSDIYLYFNDTGTARMLYVPIPAKITALTQSLEVDENIATSGAYYLAEHFALADQNSELAAMCRDKFAQLSIQKPKPINSADIIDCYNIAGIK
jgi:hypothetical protein